MSDPEFMSHDEIAAQLKRDTPQWTSEPPKAEGWYFINCPGNRREVVKVSVTDGRLYAYFHGARVCALVENVEDPWWPIPIPEPPR